LYTDPLGIGFNLKKFSSRFQTQQGFLFVPFCPFLSFFISFWYRAALLLVPSLQSVHTNEASFQEREGSIASSSSALFVPTMVSQALQKGMN
jgi:hypothetical protein